MDLKNLSRFKLAEYPTPIHFLKTLTKAFDGPDIYMKRDDLISLGMGGNPPVSESPGLKVRFSVSVLIR